MALDRFDREISESLKNKLLGLEEALNADVIYFFGEIHPTMDKNYRDFIEELKADQNSHENLAIILNTPGGSAETTEKLVKITRFHYNEVYFLIPDFAMSAGTIWCMSGDKIYMDYSSSLGPIDPQVFNGTKYVPALGYLGKAQELINKINNNEAGKAEFILLREMDLAELWSFEQQRDLSISLLKEWLTRYKFKNWKRHRTDSVKKGKPVTDSEKEERAKEIAEKLNDTARWYSHGRMIDINTLQNELRLEIENYSHNPKLYSLIRSYNDILTGYIARMNYSWFLHSRMIS